jgi:anti-sigma factor RsiW
MAADPTPNHDLQRLNALIDGELPPAEHAALAARIAAGRDLAQAHATLARLKASIVEGAADGPAPSLPPLRAFSWKRSAGFAGAATAAAALMLAIIAEYGQRASESHLQSRPDAAIVLAALPALPVVPDLAVAGLQLVGTEVETVAGVSLLVAAYRGPRGCRLELRVHPSAATVPPTRGTSRRAWTVGELGYELVAFGMPAQRFAAVAGAAEAATRAGRMPDTGEGRLREARRGAPPCLG